MKQILILLVTAILVTSCNFINTGRDVQIKEGTVVLKTEFIGGGTYIVESIYGKVYVTSSKHLPWYSIKLMTTIDGVEYTQTYQVSYDDFFELRIGDRYAVKTIPAYEKLIKIN